MSDDATPAAVSDAALAALPDPVFVFDADNRVVYANDAASDATGREADALAGSAMSAVLDGATVEDVRAAADDGTPVDALLVTAGGVRVAVTARAAPLSGDAPDGRLVVAARPVADDRELTPGHRGILDRMTDAFFAVDADWQFTYVNDRARDIVGAAMADDPDGEFEGRDLWDAVPDAVDTRFYHEYHEAMATQEPVSFEEYYEPLDAYLSVRAYPSPSGLSVYFRDVTERHRREETLAEHERVLRQMHDITADTERSFDEQVDALLDLGLDALGVSSGALSRVRGDDYEFQAVRGLADAEPGDVVPLEATNCERAVTENKTLVMADISEDAPELTGKQGYAEWGISCYLGAPVVVEDDVYGTFCFYDETPRTDQFTEWEVTLVDLMAQWVGYELTRRRVRERLEAQNEKLDRFASIVSHDLRNPLNVLDGYLDLAEESGDREHFEQCRATVDRMELLVDDLLALARAGEGVDELAATRLDAVARHAWASIDADGTTLAVDADASILADERRLQQLLVNLFRNAVEHGGDGVTVTVGVLDDGFYVADDGPGIPADERGDVFDAGYSTAQDGTGFGLSIVEEIADAHGWTVSVTEAADG
ncbi:MAG: PAS domain-containing protein, partial [Halobacterium sp.]